MLKLGVSRAEEIFVQAGNFLHYLAIFAAGISVSFGTIWQLTAVTLSVLPLLAAAGGAYLAIRVGQTKWSQKAYATAGGIAEEVEKKVLRPANQNLYHIQYESSVLIIWGHLWVCKGRPSEGFLASSQETIFIAWIYR